ncbi:ribonuclease H [Senna tora]|uniref:Ribonuclease H n=1 Tax=Senna tora TaxID=362788 RepID=A0A834TFF1_9FABA|nr:ribonuclease H [Senna tora]
MTSLLMDKNWKLGILFLASSTLQRVKRIKLIFINEPLAAACGGVIRDSDGIFIVGFSRSLGTCDILWAKLRGILKGLQMLCIHGFWKVDVETDSQNAINLISHGVIPPTRTLLWCPPSRSCGLVTRIFGSCMCTVRQIVSPTVLLKWVTHVLRKDKFSWSLLQVMVAILHMMLMD